VKMSVVGTAVLLALTLVSCGGTSDPESTPTSGSTSTASSPAETDTDTDTTSSAAACGEQTTPHPELARQLPAGFPTVAGWSATGVVTQGHTRAVQGVLRGEAADLVRVRDTAASQIVAAGYTRTGSDEEPGFEAEAEFEGPHEVSIKIKPLCRGYLALTYTVRQ
jgi:hypothetical protein